MRRAVSTLLLAARLTVNHERANNASSIGALLTTPRSRTEYAAAMLDGSPKPARSPRFKLQVQPATTAGSSIEWNCRLARRLLLFVAS